MNKDHSIAPKHVVIMGVTGSGKTTVGKILAEKLGATFVDGDSLHPADNIAKMKAGKALDDADRKPWLETIAGKLASAGENSIVVACSALKKSYRDIFRAADPTVRFVLLHGSRELLSERLSQRKGHFMPPSLLQSQLGTLEPLGPTESGITLDIAATPDELSSKAALWLRVGRR